MRSALFFVVAFRSATRQMLVEQRNDCARVTSLGFQARETQSLVRSSRKPPMGGLTRRPEKAIWAIRTRKIFPHYNARTILFWHKSSGQHPLFPRAYEACRLLEISSGMQSTPPRAVAHELGTLGRLDRKSEMRPAQKVDELMLKLLLPLTALFAISGCCQLFGVCTSASVHTSISSPNQFVRQGGSQNRLALAAESSPGQ